MIIIIIIIIIIITIRPTLVQQQNPEPNNNSNTIKTKQQQQNRTKGKGFTLHLPKEPSERQISSESLAEGCAPRMVTLRNFRISVRRPPPPQTFAASKPLKFASPLGNGGVLRSQVGERFRKEGDGGEGPIFQQPFSLPERAQTLAGIASRAAGESGKNFPAASAFADKTLPAKNFIQPQPSRVSDKHMDCRPLGEDDASEVSRHCSVCLDDDVPLKQLAIT